MRRGRFTGSSVPLLLILAASLPAWSASSTASATPPTLSERMEMAFRYAGIPGRMPGLALLEPHWLPDGDRFWYAEGAPEDTVIHLVDAVLRGAPETGAGGRGR